MGIYECYEGSLPLDLPVEDKGNRLEFIPNTHTGFLPIEDPLATLPEEFNALEMLLQELPIIKKDGLPGLLAEGKLGPFVDNGNFPDFTERVEQITDVRLLHALFRDYSFLASGYLLEPCHLNRKHSKDGSFGLGRSTLPQSIAKPLSILARKLDAKPFMEYALSYALYNYKRIDKNQGITFNNLELIRWFEGTLDESGFILVHVDMVSHSGGLIAAVDTILKAYEVGASLLPGLRHLEKVFRAINDSMEKMWERSTPKGYEEFRTFIMGIKNQPMFPNGVVYEGVSPTPQSYRGESGANDSIIPLLDNLFELTAKMPTNPLTEILRDFRNYRPILHEKYLREVELKADGLTLQCLKERDSGLLYLYILNMIREFRWRHWHFTKAYILAFTTHPVATGGSPIVRWLPNQLRVVLEELVRHIQMYILKFGGDVDVVKLQDKAKIDLRVLEKEISKLEKNLNSNKMKT